MYFRSPASLSSTFLSVLGLGLCALINLTACTDFLHGQKEKDDVISLDLKELSCLKQMPLKIEAYLNDTAEANDVRQVMGCLRTSMASFMRYTRGTSPDFYSSKELQHFFNRYLLDKNQISDAYLRELMHLKVLFVGGSEDRVTRGELLSSEKSFLAIEEQALKLQGNMRLLFFDELRARVSPARLVQVQGLLRSSLLELFAQSKMLGTSYRFGQLSDLIFELGMFLGEKTDLVNIKKWFPLIKAAKDAAFGSEAHLQTAEDWHQAIGWTVDSLFLALSFEYNLRGSPLDTVDKLDSFAKWVDSLLQQIEESPAMKRNGLIQAEHLDRMIDAVLQAKILDFHLSPTLLKMTYRKLIFRFIESSAESIAKAHQLPGLSLAQLKVIKSEWLVWKLGQSVIGNLFQQPKYATEGVDFAIVRKFANEFSIQQLIEKIDPTQKVASTALLRSWSDFKNLLNQDRPLLWGKNSRLIISPNLAGKKTTLVGMSLHNSIRSLSRLILRGYGDPGTDELFDRIIKESQMVQFEEDFREFGHALSFLDPRSQNPAERLFKEANFLTFHGNGDEFIDSRELVEVSSLLISGGFQWVSDVWQDLKGADCLEKDLDIFGQEKANQKCFLKQFLQRRKEWTPATPRLGFYLQNLTEDQLVTFYQQGMLVGRVSLRMIEQLNTVICARFSPFSNIWKPC